MKATFGDPFFFFDRRDDCVELPVVWIVCPLNRRARDMQTTADGRGGYFYVAEFTKFALKSRQDKRAVSRHVSSKRETKADAGVARFRKDKMREGFGSS